MQYNVVQRTPILPLNICQSSYVEDYIVLRKKVGDLLPADVIKNIDSLAKFNSSAHLKFIRRASYRTAFANGFVNEVKQKENEKENTTETNPSVPVILQRKYVYLTPFLILRDNEYDYYASRGQLKSIEINGFIERLVNICDAKDYFSKEELILELCNFYKREDVEETIQYLIESEFLLERTYLKEDRGSITTETLWVPHNKGVSDFDVKVPRKQIVEAYSILTLFMGSTVLSGEIEAISEFYERYGEKFIPFINLMHDKEMMEMIAQIRIRLNSDGDLIRYINAICDITEGDECKFKLKDLKRFLSNKTPNLIADIFANVYQFEEDRIVLDLDTGHSLYQNGSASSLLPYSNYTDIEYDFYDEGLKYTSLKNRPIEELKRPFKELDNLYIGVSEGHFIIVEKVIDGYRRVLFSKKNLVDISFYPLPLQVLLVCSDYLNANINILNEWKMDASRFVNKRISIGNIIIRRKRWNVGNIRLIKGSFKEFRNQIEELMSSGAIDEYVVLPMGDTERVISLRDSNDLKFLFKEAENCNLWVKEDLQGSSPFLYAGEKYSNQVIISSLDNRKAHQKIDSVDISEDRPYNSLEFITIKLRHPRLDAWEIKKELLLALNDLGIHRYFYVHYMHHEQDEFRLRVSIDSLYSILQMIRDRFTYEIEPFLIERCRFSSLVEEKLVQFYINDSNRLSHVLSNKDCIRATKINTLTFLTYFCGNDIVAMLSILEPMIDVKQEYVASTSLEAVETDEELTNMLVDLFDSECRHLPDGEIRSIIHISNNKICGVDRISEIQAYKELYRILNRARYIHGY